MMWIEGIVAVAVLIASVAVAVAAPHIGVKGDTEDPEWEAYRCEFE